MTHFSKGDYVMRKVNVCGVLDIWYGNILFWGNSKNGRLLIVVEGPEFTFISDPSHLEKVHEFQRTSTQQNSEVHKSSSDS